MAIVKLNPVIQEFRGSIGDVTIRHVGGRAVASRKVSGSGPRSEGQLHAQEQFAAAVAYAKSVMADPEKAEVYRTRGQREQRSPFRLAMSDALKGQV
jgi:hypothetical protein